MGPTVKAFRLLGNILTLATFGLLSVLPVLTLSCESEGAPGAGRDLAAFPARPTDLTSMSKWPTSFEKWFSDHFGLRSQLLSLHTRILMDGFAVSPTDQVVVGTDGWLYYTRDGIFPDRRGEVRLKDWELTNWRSALEARRDWLREQGISYVFAVPPNKVTVCPEHLPPRHRERPDLPTRVQQLVQWMKRNSNFEILDLQPVIAAAARTELVYHVRDSHWNNIGAHHGYLAVLDAFGQRGVSVEPITREELKQSVRTWNGDLTRLIPSSGFVDEPAPFLEPKAGWRGRKVPVPFDWTTLPADFGVWEAPVAYECEQGVGSLLVMGDSYLWAMRPFLAEHFRNALFVTASVVDFEVFKAMVAFAKPTVVLEMRVERNLKYTPKWHPPQKPK